MTKKTERNVLFLDLNVKTKTRSPGISGLPLVFTISDLFKKIDELRASGNVNVLKGTGSNKKEIYLADLEEDKAKKCWKLLINVTDTSLADEVHRKIGGSDSRKVNKKGDGVGTDFSSHIVIKSKLEKNGSYVTLYEQSNALPVSLVSRYLNDLFLRLAKKYPSVFEIPHPKNSINAEGKSKMINTYCHCHFNGHVSNEFKNDLNSGKINDLKLITAELQTVVGYDSQKHPEIKEVQLPIEIDKGAILKAGGNYTFMNRIRKNIAKDLDMQEIKISFKDSGGVSHTAKIDTVTGNLINSEKYVKKIKVTDFDQPLTTSVDLLHKPLIDQMIEHL